MRRKCPSPSGPLTHHRVLICDRDAKWSPAVLGHLEDAGLRVVQTPVRLEFVVRPPLGAGPSPGSGRPD